MASASDMIFRLEKNNVVLCKKISTAIDRNLKLDRKLATLKEQVDKEHGRSLKEHRKAGNKGSFMSKIGSGTAMETMKRRQQQEVKMKEHEKHRLSVMCDKINDKCLALRRTIDDLRKDAVSQNDRFGSIQREVERIKLEMAKILDDANKVDAECMGIREKRQRMADAGEKENDDFRATHFEVLTFKRKPMSKRREAVQTMDVGTTGLTPAQRTQRRLKELAAEAASVRAADSDSAKRVEQYEAAFEALRRCTGLSDLEDVVAVFVEEEDRKLRQMQVIQDMTDQAKALELECREVSADMEAYEKQWGAYDEKQQDVINGFKVQLETLRRDAKDAETRKSKASMELDRVGEALHRLFYSMDCEPLGVELTMHELTVDRERRDSFFGPVRRPSDVHKDILASMKEEVAKGNTATLDLARTMKSYASRDDDEKEEEEEEGGKLPSPSLYHKAMLPALADPDDETFKARTQGTPSRRGTRSHAKADVEQLMKTGVNPDNMKRYLAIVEQRANELMGQLTRQAQREGAPVPESALAKEGPVTVLAPPMEDFDALSNELDRAAANYAADLAKSLKSLRAGKLNTVSPAWRESTPALSPVNAGGRSRVEGGKKKQSEPLPRVVSRSELEAEVQRDLGESDLSHFIRRIRLEDGSAPPLPPKRPSSGSRRKGSRPGSPSMFASAGSSMFEG